MKFTIIYKLSLSAIILVLLSASLVGIVFYNKTTELLVEQAAEDIASDVRNTSSKLQSIINSQRGDTLFLSRTPPVQGILRAIKNNNYDKQGESSTKLWISRLQSIFSTLLSSKPDYLTIRLIDKTGREMIVVTNKNNKSVILDKKDLQNKSHRKYVKDTLKRPEGSVYLSEINLNREHNKISVPHQEVLRSATPVIDKQNGELAGLIVITAEIGTKFRDIKQSNKNETSRIYITNDHGGYLIHPDERKGYGFDLGKQYRIQEDIPQLAKLYLPDNTDTSLILLPGEIHNQHVLNFIKIPFDPENPQRFIAVAITELYSHIVSKQTPVLNNVIILSLTLVISVAFLAIVFSYRISKPIKQITQVMDDYTHHRITNEVMPINQNDEIGVLARSYKNLISEVEEAQYNLREMNSNLETMVSERTQELKLSETRQRSIVENMADGLITINSGGIIRSFNSAASTIFGYQPIEVLGKPVAFLLPPRPEAEPDQDNAQYHPNEILRIIGDRRELEGKRKNGEIFTMDISVSEIIVNDKQIYSSVIRDITERKQIEKLKNEFVSTVSHELRTPLTAIRGALGLINGGAMGTMPEKASDLLKLASSNTERLLLLINDILDIQKIESGVMDFNFRNMHLVPLIKQALDENKSYGKQFGIEYILKNEIENDYIYADSNRLMQVFANLLSNAAKFSEKGDTVEISLACNQDEYIHISITDHGEGIPEKFHAKLFEKFTQSDSSNTRQKGGTGLGLSISKVIIEKHGGEIYFSSREGEGSTFTIKIPAITSERD